MSNQSKLFEEELAKRNPDWEKIVACHNDALAAERELVKHWQRRFDKKEEQLATEREKRADWNVVIEDLQKQLAAEREVGGNTVIALAQQITKLEDKLAVAVEALKLVNDIAIAKSHSLEKIGGAK